jgi:hypothetical protein
MGRTCSTNVGRRGMHIGYLCECQKTPLRRSRRSWADNIKMDLREIGWGCMDWIDMAHDRDQWSYLVYKLL